MIRRGKGRDRINESERVRERERGREGERERRGDGEERDRGMGNKVCENVTHFVSIERDVCSELKVNCSSHSKCRNAPDSEEGYDCVCDSGYERKGNSCSFTGWEI